MTYLKILVVDDEKDLLGFFQITLKKINFIIVSIQSIVDIRRIYERSDDHDLVISDIRIPEMNRIELASIIRKVNKDISIILMALCRY
jgi:DNA-binding NtrC family response regulator